MSKNPKIERDVPWTKKKADGSGAEKAPIFGIYAHEERKGKRLLHYYIELRRGVES